jgi:hypothetical protein
LWSETNGRRKSAGTSRRTGGAETGVKENAGTVNVGKEIDAVRTVPLAEAY